MHQLSTFQIVVLGIFAALTLIGVGVFAVSGGFTRGDAVGPVTIWGTMETDVVQGVLDTLRPQDKTFQDVTYIEKNQATYRTELINAMAAGQGPDLFLLPLEDLLAFQDKILTIPYRTLSQGKFANAYLDEAQLFLTAEGSLALPFVIDPLVMYWNRDMFVSAGFANPPQYWNDFLVIAPKISSLDGTSAVKRSAVSLGVWSNIPHAKAILSSLFMQAGDGIVVRSQEGRTTVVFGNKPDGAATEPATSALRFYTEFANPTKTTYSWNRSLPRASDMFASGDLAVYFGFASEYDTFAARNPNLRYAVALLPQIEGNTLRATYGKLVGLAIPRTSRNIEGAYAVAERLSDQNGSLLVSQATGLPPVRRDVSIDTSQNAAMATFVQSTLIARGWLDPSPEASDQIFATMVDSVVSGRSEPAGAVFDASQEFFDLVGR